MQSIFERIKDRVEMPEIAERYGFELNQSHMICCPFHGEKTASMRIYSDHWHCFGCGQHGDSVKFVQQLYNLSAIDAARKINSDFGLGIAFGGQKPEVAERREPTKAEIRKAFEAWQKYAFKVLDSYYKLLCEWYDTFRPTDPDKPLNPLFLRACREKDYIDYCCSIFCQGSEEKRLKFYKEKKNYITILEGELENYGYIRRT